MNLLASRPGRRLLFGALYMSEGAPIGFIWWYLPTHLRAAGVPIEHITGLTAALVLPWTLKFLWAPLVDALRGRGLSLKAWIISAQFVMGSCLIPLVFLDPVRDLPLFTVLLLVHAVSASTQDVAIDALSIAVTTEHERGSINGWMQAGMLLGRSAFGGIALVAVDRFGHAAVVGALIVAIWGTLALILGIREPRVEASERSMLGSLRAAARMKTTWLGLGFALVAGAGFEAAGAVAGPFLIDAGLARSDVGRFLALPAVVAMLGGALLGGYLSDRFGRVRMTTLFLFLIAAGVAGLALVAPLGPAASMMVLAAVYLGIGLFTAASYALFMDLTLPRLGGTQFSTYMAATNACESWSTLAVGRLSGRFGYASAFGVMAAASLLALPMLVGIARRMRGREASPD